MSADVRMLLPLLVGILVAKWVADAGTHSLYHGLLEVKCVPWLPSVPVSFKSLDLVPITQAMAAPVVVLHEKVSYAEIRSALRGTEHNGFPIVHATPIGQVKQLPGAKLICSCFSSWGSKLICSKSKRSAEYLRESYLAS